MVQKASRSRNVPGTARSLNLHADLGSIVIGELLHSYIKMDSLVEIHCIIFTYAPLPSHA